MAERTLYSWALWLAFTINYFMSYVVFHVISHVIPQPPVSALQIELFPGGITVIRRTELLNSAPFICLKFWSLTFFICKVGMIIAPPHKADVKNECVNIGTAPGKCPSAVMSYRKIEAETI